MVKHYALTLNGSEQLLSSVLPAGDETKSIRFLSLQAKASNSAVVYYGGSGQLVSSSVYMGRIEAPVTSIPAAPTIFEFTDTVTNLAQWKVLGTNNDVLLIGILD